MPESKTHTTTKRKKIENVSSAFPDNWQSVAPNWQNDDELIQVHSCVKPCLSANPSKLREETAIGKVCGFCQKVVAGGLLDETARQ